MAETLVEVTVAHCPWDPGRRANLNAQKRRLDPQLRESGRRLLVVCDVQGADNRGCRLTQRAAVMVAVQAARRSGATHVVDLSDDMLPCRHFVVEVEAALEAQPEALVALFSMRRCALEAVRARSPFVVDRTADGMWGGSLAMPVAWAARAMDWAGEVMHHDPGCKCRNWDDTVLKYYARVVEPLPTLIAAPSLLEHTMPGESMLGYSNRNRVASAFAGDDPPPLSWWAQEPTVTTSGGSTWRDLEDHFAVTATEAGRGCRS